MEITGMDFGTQDLLIAGDYTPGDPPGFCAVGSKRSSSRGLMVAVHATEEVVDQFQLDRWQAEQSKLA
ncbi:UNVERIFIED_CONTAM: hypothetical protein FKN15_039067 [Acipenser sinensis]